MASRDETRRRSNSEADSFEGRALLVGRPERAAARKSAAAAGQTPLAAPSQQPAAHDDAIRVLLSVEK